MPKATPARAPQAAAERDHAPIIQTTSKAGSKPPPATTGAASVFALAQAAKPPRQRVDIAAVAIQRGVPVPPPQSGKGAASPYAQLLAKMQPGDMVQLPYRQGYGLLSMGKKLKVPLTRRTLGVGVLGIWRL